MHRRIISAFLATVLLISNVSISTYAMSEDSDIKTNTTEETTSESNLSEDNASEDNSQKDNPSGDNASEDDSPKDNPSEDNASEDNTSEDNIPKDDPSENDTMEDNPSDYVDETDSDEELDTDMDAEAEAPSASMTQSFLVDTQSPYDGDYLLVANVSTDAAGEAETVGTLPAEDKGSYGMNAYGAYIYSTDNPSVYDYDENGRGIIDPASFLPEPVIDDSGIDFLADTEQDTIEYYIGYERSFYLNTTADSQYTSVDCVCVAISEYATVWVPVEDPIYVSYPERMKGYMNELAIEFDTQFPKMTEMFGSKETVDSLYGDNDGKTALLCYDINGNGMSGSSYTAGYFFAADLKINYSNRTKNDIDCLHIDSWQGMSRNTSANTLNSVYGKRTMVHELQHMINYSICRNNESKFLALKIPTYLNEAYSEAAAHLCYGEASSRISNYNSNTYIAGGKVSLLDWGGHDTLSNYALSYLFGQYIRTQYENGDTIYRDSMNALNESTDLLSVIADTLGITAEELLFNFRAALFLKNAEGIYGFGGEAWAESVRSNSTKAGTGLSLAPGAAVVIPISDTFEPDGAGINIRFAGMYTELTTDAMSVHISGGDLISEDQGQLQLSATVLPETINQSVIFFLPDLSDSAYAQVTASGLVSAVSNGSVTVRASSVYNPSKYADITITISGQQAIRLEKEHTPVFGGMMVKYSVIEPDGAALYYTTDGEVPTVESETLPEEGLLFDTAGLHTLKVLAHDPSGTFRDVIVDDEIILKQLNEPVISTEDVLVDETYTKRVTIQADDGVSIFYTTDGSVPSADNGTLYQESFIIDTLGTTEINAIAVKEGAVAGRQVKYEVIVQLSLDIESIHTPVLGGIKVNYAVNAASDITIYYTTDGKTPTTDSEIMPDEGIFIDTAGTHTIKLLSHDPSGLYRDVYDEDVIVVEQLNEPVISAEEVLVDEIYTQRVTIQAEDGASIFYTTDGSVPSADNGTLYQESFIIDTLGTTEINAIAVKEGAVAGRQVKYEVIVQLSLDIESIHTPVFGGIKVNYAVNAVSDITIYYTADGKTPTTDNEIMPDDGIFIDTAGTHTIKLLSHDPSGLYRDVYGEDVIVVEQLNEPVISAEEVLVDETNAQRVTIQADDGALVYFTTDDSTPSADNGTRYQESFIIDTPGITVINAIAVKEGAVASRQVKYEVAIQSAVDIDKIHTPVLGGIKVNYAVNAASDITIYYTTDGKTPTTDSEIMPDDGIFIDTAGTHTLKLLSHDPSGLYSDVYDEDIIVVEQLKKPEIITETESASLGTQRVTIQAQDGALVYYTTDASLPSVENGTEYETPFTIDTQGTTTVKAFALKEGMAVSEVASKEVTVQYVSESMTESERSPYLTRVSFSLNKKAINGTRFSILPIMENEIVDAKLVNYSDDFSLERVQGTNDWEISLVNKYMANKTYQAQILVVSKGADNIGYADEIGIKLKITDVTPKVSLKTVTINTLYPSAAYPLTATSKSGDVEILGISNAQDAGFTDNFEVRDGALYLKRQYDEFVKTSKNKPVLAGKLQVQVEGYEPQELTFNVKTTNKPPKLIQSVSSIRLNYNKLQEDKCFRFTLDRQVGSKERHLLENITSVTLNEKGGKNYEKAAELIQNISLDDDGQNIIVDFKDIKPGTYTLPLLVSAGAGENSFSNVSCNVKIVIEKENVNPALKLSTTKLRLNRQTSGEKAYIAVNSVSQYNMILTDIQCIYDPSVLTQTVNKDNNVSLSYNSDTNMLEARIINVGKPACDTYKFVCTPVYKDMVSEDKATAEAAGDKITVTVTLIDKTPSVSLKAKGSIDVLNRDTTSVTYTINKVNFTDEVEEVKFKQASKLTGSILDAREYFNEPVLNEDSTITISAKEDVPDDVHHFTKGMKYAFRLEFTLKDSKTDDAPNGITVETKDITIKPKQSKVKLTASSKPLFYTYVNTGNNIKDVALICNNGAIEKVEWNTDANRKIPEGITPIFDDGGQLKCVTFNGGNIKKGTYKLTFNVYYKGQLWEKATSRKASYAKPAVFKLTVSVK